MDTKTQQLPNVIGKGEASPRHSPSAEEIQVFPFVYAMLVHIPHNSLENRTNPKRGKQENHRPRVHERLTVAAASSILRL